MNIFTRVVRSFLWRSKIGRLTAEKFWKRRNAGDDMRYLFYKEASVIEDLPICFEEEVFNKFLRENLGKWEIQRQAEYVLEIDDVLVEPERSLGTKGLNQLIEQTVVFTVDYQYPYILPHLLNRNKSKFIKAAVLYDGSATRNLYHHLVETVCRLSMLSKTDLPADIPIIVNRFVYDSPFFQYLFSKSPYFKSFNWLIQEPHEWLQVEKLYRPKALYFGKESWNFTRKLYNLGEITPSKKVFLSRDKKRYTRGLSNEVEIINMLHSYGFEVAYAEHLSLDEQVKLFQETEYLVALTGMGLIQQFFMSYEKAHVIEIIPVNRLMPEYYCQAYSLGIKYYDVVLGEDIDRVPMSNSSHKRYEGLKEYEVDIHKLESAVLKMLNAPADKKHYGNFSAPLI
ncbi:glycosyltransferase family 61 protein [Hymenobacter sp. UV11]|uniref:glycosyltransferase family 61 protein n=1 Tax=Hymenobacter sp. UV11 TaxID=1849735 RepID=UPI00105DD88C|nr:glycosyltransferase family 61 protein [Hymenobacter sp. UV11]TFZ67420.1 glycosyltransferase family 61 protein [Hymenobacter sp. UV11]